MKYFRQDTRAASDIGVELPNPWQITAILIEPVPVAEPALVQIRPAIPRKWVGVRPP